LQKPRLSWLPQIRSGNARCKLTWMNKSPVQL
jgi:hypothetical protein